MARVIGQRAGLRRLRSFGLVLALLAPLLAPGAARAEIRRITLRSPAPVTLDATEQAKLEALRDVKSIRLVSTISPDGTTVVVRVTDLETESAPKLALLDVATGELSDFPALDLNPAELGSLRWRDN